MIMQKEAAKPSAVSKLAQLLDDATKKNNMMNC